MHIKVRKTSAKKKDAKPNPQREFVESLLKCTYEELSEKLHDVTHWQWPEQDDIYNWAELLNKFDDFLATLPSFYETHTVLNLPIPNKDFPRQAVLDILRFSLLVLENCFNRHLYGSVEHLAKLIELDDTEVVLAVLSLLAAYVSRIQMRSPSQPFSSSLNSQLFYLAKGWGGKQDGLGLCYCSQQEDVSTKLAIGTTLHFEFYVDPSVTTAEAGESKAEKTDVAASQETKKDEEERKEEPVDDIGVPVPGQTIIHVPNLHTFKESNLEILHLLVKKYRIPRAFHFPLLVRIRLARAFPSLEERRNFIRNNLLSFTILAEQAQADPNLMNSFFLYEPEFISELMELVRSEVSLPADFRILSLRALSALLADHSRLHSLISATGSSLHHGELPSMIRKSVATLTSGVEHPVYTLPFIETLFTFLSSLMGTQEGIIALNNAGAIASLLPLLNHNEPKHNAVLLKCLNILEFYISASSSAISSSASLSLFRDLGGLDSLVSRFNKEIEAVRKQLAEGEEMVADEGKGKEKVKEGEPKEEKQLDNRQRTLIKTLSRVILPFVQGGRRRNVGRLISLIEGPFPASLRFILQHYRAFGDTIFSSAILLMSGLINNDPTRFSVLQEAGLPTEFLSFVVKGLEPSSSVLLTVPSALSSICLNANGLASVTESHAVQALFSIFTEPKFKKALRRSETASVLGSGLDELMRHHPTLRPIGVASAVDLLKRIATLGGLETKPATPPASPSQSTPTTPVQSTGEQPAGEIGESVTPNPSPVALASSSEATATPMETTASTLSTPVPVFVQPEQLQQQDLTPRTLEAFIGNTGMLFESLFVNNEHANAFLKSKGIDLMLTLFRLPKIPGLLNSSCAQSLAAAFRTLAAQHSADVLKEILACLALQFDSLDKQFPAWRDGLGFIKEEDDPAVLSTLSGIDCYAGLLSGMVRDPNGLSNAPFQTLTQWTTGNGVSVSLSLGQLQRCILWELANHSYGEKKKKASEKSEKSDTLEEKPAESTAAEPSKDAMETDPTTEAKPVTEGGEGAPPSEKPREPQTKERIIHLVSSIHSLSQGLVRALAEGHRRRDEKIVGGIVQTLAKTLSDHLVWAPKSMDASELPVKAAYLSSVVGELRSLLFNERHNSTHTLLLHAFNHVDGVAHLLSTFEWTVEAYAGLRAKEIEKGRNKDAMAIDAPQEGKGKEKETSTTGEVSPVAESDSNEPRDVDIEIVESTLLTYGGFLRFLVAGPMLFGSPITASMLTFHNLPGQSGPFDPYTFLAGIQCKVLVSVLPVWNHELFPQFPPSFITSLLLTNNYIMEGEAHSPKPKEEEKKAKPMEVDPAAVLALQEMGFPAEHAAEALRQVGSNSVELATEWLFNNPLPEPAAPPKALSEEEELAQALAMSLGQELAPATPEKPKEINYAEQYAILRKGMLEKCLSLIASLDSSSSTVSDLLIAMCKKGDDRTVIINSLLAQIKTAAAQKPPAKSLHHVLHVLVRILLADSSSRQLVTDSGIIMTLLSLLSSAFSYTADGSAADEGEEVPAPKWLSTIILLLDVQTQLPSAIVVKKQTITKPAEVSAVEPTKPGEEAPAKPAEVSADPTKPSEEPKTEGTVPVEETPKEKEPTKEVEAPKTATEEETVYDYEVPSYLTPQERALALEHCGGLLQHKLDTNSLHAVLQLCARLTRDYELALQFVKEGGLTTLLSLSAESAFSGQAALVSSILRHIVEEPALLQSVMESEIKSTLGKMTGRGGTPVKPKTFLTAVSPLVCRDPGAFLRAAAATCRLKDPRPNVPLGRVTLILAPETAQQKENKDEPPTPQKSDSVTPTTPAKTPKTKKRPPPSLIQVVTELINSMQTLSQLKDHATDDASEAPKEQSAPSRKGKEKETTEAKPATPFLTTAEILRVLTDFINAYPPCSTVVLRHRFGKAGKSKRGGKGKLKESDATGVNNVLSFILRDLIPYPGESKPGNEEVVQRRKQENVAAANLLATLAQRPEGRKRIINELTQAMEAQVKEKCTEETYPHALQALVDFLYLLLTASASQTPARSNPAGVLGDVARLMLDANTISILTKALHSVDLNHPDAVQLVTAILKPLEVLTRITTVIAPKKAEKHKKKVTEEQAQAETAPTDSGETAGSISADAEAAAENVPVEHDIDEADSMDAGEGAPDESQILGGEHGSALGDFLNTSGGRLMGELNTVNRLFEAIAQTGQLAEASADLNALMEMTMGYIGEQARAQLAQAVDDVSDSEEEGEEMIVEDGEGEDDGEEGEGEEEGEEEGRDEEADDLEESASSSDEEEELNFGGLTLPPEPQLEGLDIQLGPGGASFTIQLDDLMGRRPGSRPAQPRHVSPFVAEASLDSHPLLNAIQADMASETSTPQPFPGATLLRDLGWDDTTRLLNRLGRPARPPAGGRGQWTEEAQRGPSTAEFVNSFEEILVETLRKISLAELKEKEAKEKIQREKAEREKAEKEKEAKEKAEQEAKERAEREAQEREAGAAQQADAVPMDTETTTPSAEATASDNLQSTTESKAPTETATPAESTPTTTEATNTTTTPESATPAPAEGTPASAPTTTAEASTTAEVSPTERREMPQLVTDQPSEQTQPTTSPTVPEVETTTTTQPTEPTPAVGGETTTTTTPTTTPAPAEGSAPAQATEPSVGAIDVGLLETAGIDPAFLAALPDDLRAEVLASQVSQLGRQPPTNAGGASASPAPSSGGGVSTSTISPDFIAALPPDIQLEMLQEEQRQQAAVADISRAEQMSTADFFATLSPALREEILMTQDASIINQLPPDIAAEAANLRERAFHQYRGGRRITGLGGPSWGGVPIPSRRLPGGPGSLGLAAKERLGIDAGPSFAEFAGSAPLEEGDLLTLVRLLYLAKPLASKGLLHRLFLNLSSHADTRIRLLQMMLSILNAFLAARQVETFDTCLGPSDRPFAEVLAQLPVVPSSSEFSPVADPCHSLLSPGVMTAYTHSGEHPPSLVSRRVLEILCHLAKSNPRVAEYVLGIKNESEKEETAEGSEEKEKEEKGKEPKDEASPPELCPLAKLMDLLGVSQFRNSSAQLAHLLQLLALSVRPLARLKEAEDRKQKEAEERERKEEEELEKKAEQKKQESLQAAEAQTEGQNPAVSGEISIPVPTLPPSEAAASPEAQPPAGETAPATSPEAQPPTVTTTPTPMEVTPETAGEPPVEEKKEEPKPEKKAEDLCPLVPEEDLGHLVNVLTLDHLAEQTYNHATSVLGTLSTNRENREVLQEKLTRAAQSMAEVVIHNLRVLQEEFVNSVNATVLLSRGSSSHEVNLLRIIKTIIALPSGAGTHSSEALLASLELEPLWEALEACLTILNEQNEKEKSKAKARALEESDGKGKEKEKDKKKKGEKTTSPAANLLLPIIEVFFVVNSAEPLPIKRSVSTLSLESLGLSSDGKEMSLSSSKSISRSGSLYNLAGTGSRFVSFAERNRGLLNDLVRENPALLQGTFKVLLKWPRALEFDNKLLFFRGELQKLKDTSRGYGYGGCRLQVRRKRVFEDSFSQMRNRTAEEFRGRLNVRFADEEGIDAGGVTRDWFDILAKEMFNANYGLFIATVQDNSTFQPNRLSYINPDHIQYFKFVGRIIGKAILDGHYLPCHFTRSFYKHMLGVSVLPNDMEAIDPEYYKNLKWILDNDMEASGLELTFSLEIDDFGTMKNVELKPGGKSILVTEDNKVEYVQLVTEMKMTTSIRSQIDAFLDGFHEIIPKELISIFNEMELELLISGLPEIDMEDLRRNTEYSGFSESHPVIQWFWKAVNSFGQEERAKLLQFVTGTSRVPLDGFTALRGISGPQKFQIHKAYRTDSLPAAHTCFNQLDLPEYESYEQLRESLLYAIRETEGFGFG